MKTEDKRIIPNCIYCVYGIGNSACRQRVEKRGKIACMRFQYDPLLRMPKPPRILQGHTEDEFKL